MTGWVSSLGVMGDAEPDEEDSDDDLSDIVLVLRARRAWGLGRFKRGCGRQ